MPTKTEYRFICLISLLLIILSTAPYIYGYLTSPAGSTFTGYGLYNWWDAPVYYGYIEQAKHGHLLFTDLYTTEPHAAFLNIFWLGAGLLAKLFHLSAPLIFHLIRIMLIPILVIALYKLFALFIKDGMRRQIALILAFFASGWGILFYNNLPAPNNFFIDMNAPEATLFESIYSSPHFIASWILLILSFYFLLKFIQRKKNYDLILAGLAALVLTQFHPFYIIALIMIPAIYYIITLIQKQRVIRFKHLIIYWLFLAPNVIYYLFLQTDAVAAYRSNNLMLSPPMLTTILSFGFLPVLALCGVFYYCKRAVFDPLWLFMIVWLCAGLGLAYSHLPYERRLFEGWLIPLILLSLFALNAVAKQKYGNNFLLTNSAKIAIILFFLISSISTFAIWGMSFSAYGTIQIPAYVSQDKQSAFDWIKTNTTEQDVFLNNDIVDANFLPGATGRRVYLGHGFETVNALAKQDLQTAFFHSVWPEQRQKDFLHQAGITYIFYSPTIGVKTAFERQQRDYLENVFKNGEVTIYQVRKD